MSNSITGKATSCGKFILLGEHFVVSGGPALAFPLKELHCEVKVAFNHHPHYQAEVAGKTDRELLQNLMARAAYAAAGALRMDISAQPLKVVSRSNFPVSRGLGSSAAFAVALARSLDALRQQIDPRVGSASLDELHAATDAVERIFHGTPSGLDSAVVFSETPIRFEKGKIVRELKNEAVDFLVADGGSRDECIEKIAEVAKFREQNPTQWEAMAKFSSELVDRCESALREGNAETVAKCLRDAQGVLIELGLSTPQVDQLIIDAEACGALAGKVSGAGGGGAVVIATRPGQAAAVQKKLTEKGHIIFAKSERRGTNAR